MRNARLAAIKEERRSIRGKWSIKYGKGVRELRGESFLPSKAEITIKSNLEGKGGDPKMEKMKTPGEVTIYTLGFATLVRFRNAGKGGGKKGAISKKKRR